MPIVQEAITDELIIQKLQGAGGSFTYSKPLPRHLTKFFGLPYRRQSDLFHALRRMCEQGLLLKEVRNGQRVRGSKGASNQTHGEITYRLAE